MTHVWNFTDIPVKSGELTKNNAYPFPVGTHEVTYLNFHNGKDKPTDRRPVRETPNLTTQNRFVVFPCYPDQKWELTSYQHPHKLRGTKRKSIMAFGDGWMERSRDPKRMHNPSSKTPQRMQDLAEEPLESENKVDKPHNVGSAIPYPMNNINSMFEVVAGSMVMLSEGSQQGRQRFECSLCRTIRDKYSAPQPFYRLSQLNEHVKNTHDVIMYSTSVYTIQQILCGRLIKKRRHINGLIGKTRKSLIPSLKGKSPE